MFVHKCSYTYVTNYVRKPGPLFKDHKVITRQFFNSGFVDGVRGRED